MPRLHVDPNEDQKREASSPGGHAASDTSAGESQGEAVGDEWASNNGLGEHGSLGAHYVAQKNGEIKEWAPERWSPKHDMIIRLQMCGMRGVEIAEYMGCTSNHVSIILNDPRSDLIRQNLASQIQGHVVDVNARLQLLANEALDCSVEIMRESTNEALAQRSAFDIMDRAGYGKVDKSIVAHAQIDAKSMDRVVEAIKETNSAFDDVVEDADYTVED